MMCSANEVMTLATKAAAGAGAPPTQAAMFGSAVLSHLGAGCKSDDISDALQLLPDGPIMELPVRIIALLEDTDENEFTVVIRSGPFAALELSYFYAQPFAVKGKTVKGETEVELMLTTPQAPAPMPRVAIPDRLYNEMQNFAARLLVPETDASRLSGAGAGLTDND